MNIESGNNVQSTIASGASNAPDILKSADRMKYALEHFKYLADQRMKTFNYYAIVVAASITGSITAFDKCPWQLVTALGVVHLAMAWIFFVIDIRNSRLVYFARQALMHFERTADLDPRLRVISLDQLAENRSSGAPGDNSARPDWQDLWELAHPFRRLADKICRRVGGKAGATFTAAFNMAFLLQVTCGLAIIAAAWWLKGPGATAGH